MDFLANHDVHHDGKAFGPNEPVKFSADDFDRFAAGVGPIAELLAARAIREANAPRVGAVLEDQPIEQLAVIAAALGLGVGAEAGRAALIAEIGAARTRLAAPIENPPRTGEEAAAGLGGNDRPPFVPAATGANLPDTGETTPRVIPELTDAMDRARLVEIANEHGVTFAANASQAKLRELIDGARRTSAAAAYVIPDLAADTGRDRLVEIATGAGLSFAPDADDAALRGLIAAERVRRTPGTM